MLKEKLLEDLKESMKEKNLIRKNTVQMIRAAILQVEKDKAIELNDDQIIDIIAKEAKKRKDAQADFEKSGREDLINQNKEELSILTEYLPKQLSAEEVEEIVKGIIYAIYFPNIIFYIITVIISFSIMIYTILSNKLTNKEKIVNYLLCGIHLYLFILFITNCLDLNVSLVRPSKIYKHDELYVLVQSCQLVFVVNIIYQSVKMLVRKLKNKSKNDIMDRK